LLKETFTSTELVERLNAETPALFILKDFNRFLTDLSISRKLRNISHFKITTKNNYYHCSDLTIPKELQDLLTVLQFELTRNEISQELDRLVNF
jgi:heme oxygenase